MKKQECDDIFGTLQQAPNISSYERSLTKVKRRHIDNLIDVDTTSCVYWVSTFFFRASLVSNHSLDSSSTIVNFPNMANVVPWCSGYHYCTTSFNKAWTQVLHRLKFCTRRVGDSRWWRSLTMVPAGNNAKCLSSVYHTTKTIHHHHH